MFPIEFLYASCRRTPKAAAIETENEVVTYASLVEQVNALAAALQALEEKPQSRVAICGYNSLEHLIGLLAVMAAGKVWIPLNPRDGRDDIQLKIEAAQPSILILDEDCEDRVGLFKGKKIVGFGGIPTAMDTIAGLIEKNLCKRPKANNYNGENIQAIKFTGGSSGRPKGVLQPYRAWLTGAACMINELKLTSGDRYLVCSPLTHGTSCYITPILGVGGTLVLGKRIMKPPDILDAFEKRGITTSFIPPTVIYMMMLELGSKEQKFPMLSRLIYGGAPMPFGKIRAAQGVFGPVLATNYGQTEAPQIVTYLSPNEMLIEKNIESVGRSSFLTRVSIMEPNGNEELPQGKTGEIVVSGDLLMSEYLDMPDATSAVKTGNWLRTGDVGLLDDRGYLFIKDRLRDVIISGGFNVYPSDVEAALVKHPAIYECVVYGLPDEKWGEIVQASVVLKKGGKSDETEMLEFAKKVLGSVKSPKHIKTINDLPRSSVGKVLRREVRENALLELKN